MQIEIKINVDYLADDIISDAFCVCLFDQLHKKKEVTINSKTVTNYAVIAGLI